MRISSTHAAIIWPVMAMAYPHAYAHSNDLATQTATKITASSTTTPPTSIEATTTSSPNASCSPTASTTAACTVTSAKLANPLLLGLMKGVCKTYISTVTSTNHVNCGGCVLETVAFYQGHGPAVRPCTTTETLASTVTWTLACANSTGMASVTGTGGDGVGEGGIVDRGMDSE
ncbi:hypothetical protein FKW77_008271 [Venturia effusa]|uniref:Cyanovirin-N domain-containing protein n=1 Tax=Venturia effusa TaxID=50376 RepID=A0A517LBC5_9PEZI|nr:hypothetical protein FKW77_008271 [Venturia effusa]